ncbi:MAG: DUF4412 domain-containing protein [Bacteroidota bacterium]
MRITTIVMSVALVAFSATLLLAQKSFEGVIAMQGAGTTEMGITFYVKGDLALIDMANAMGGPGKMLSNRKTKIITSLIEKDGQKIALKMGPDMLKGMGSMGAQGKANMAETEVKVTGNTKKIGKYTCKEVIATADGNQVTAWITDELGLTLYDLFPIMEDAIQMSGAGDKAMVELLREGMVLEAVMKRKGSDVPEKLVTTVEEKALPDDMFAVSEEDYKVFDLTDMVKMMQEMQGDPEKMKEFQELMKSLNQN